MKQDCKNTDRTGGDAFITAVYLSDKAIPDNKTDLASVACTKGQTLVFTPQELNESDHIALIPWVASYRKKWRPGFGPSAKTRFIRAEYAGIDFDKEGFSREAMISRIKENLGDVGFILSRSTSGRKWHCIIRLAETIYDYKQYAAVRTHLAELVGGDARYQAFLFRCPTAKKYEEIAGEGYCWKHIKPTCNERKAAVRKAATCEPSSERDRLIHTILSKCLKERKMSGSVAIRVSRGCVNFAFAHGEKSPWSLYYYPDAQGGTHIHHFDKGRFKGALYGKKLDSRVFRYLEEKGVNPAEFNKAINKCRSRLCPRNAVKCVKFMLGENPNPEQALSLLHSLLSVRTRFIRHNLKQVLSQIKLPQMIKSDLFAVLPTGATAILSRLKTLISQFDKNMGSCASIYKTSRARLDRTLKTPAKRKRNAVARGKRRGKRMVLTEKRRHSSQRNGLIQKIVGSAMRELGFQ